MKYKVSFLEKYLNVKDATEADYERLKPELKTKFYEDLTSNDPNRALTAAKILVHLDDLGFNEDEVKVLRACRKKLPSSKICITRDYRIDVNVAINVIDHFVKGNKCKCKIYKKWMQFLPKREADLGYLEMKGEPFTNREKIQIEYKLFCKECKTNWFVEEPEMLMVPVYKWTKVESSGPSSDSDIEMK